MPGQGSIIITPKSSSGGGTVTGAQNGLSLSSAKVVLGQDQGAGGNPAALTNDREIPMAGHTIILTLNTANAKAIKVVANYDAQVNGFEVLNTNAGVNAKAQSIFTNDGSKSLAVGIDSSGANFPNRRFIDSGNGQLHLGDVLSTVNNTGIVINDPAKLITLAGNVAVIASDPATVAHSITMAALQSANPFEIRTSGGTLKLGSTAAGRFGFTDYCFVLANADIAFGDILGTSYAVIGAAQGQGVKFRDNAGNVPFAFEFNSGTNPFADLNIMRTAAITGSVTSRGKWKLGAYDGTGSYTGNTHAVEVEINGTKYYLLTGTAS